MQFKFQTESVDLRIEQRKQSYQYHVVLEVSPQFGCILSLRLGGLFGLCFFLYRIRVTFLLNRLRLNDWRGTEDAKYNMAYTGIVLFWAESGTSCARIATKPHIGAPLRKKMVDKNSTTGAEWPHGKNAFLICLRIWIFQR